MDSLIIVAQLIAALGIFNVWILRYGQSTSWRGGDAKNMKEEFAVYGLPSWFMGVVGFFKLLFATALIVGVWFPEIVKPAAVGLAVLMVGAVLMHLKVRDPLQRSLPALSVLALCLVVAID